MGRVAWPVKWVLVPAAAGAVGYYLVGPHYAGKVAIPKAVQEGVARIAPGIAGAKDAPAPSVSVGVKPVETPPEDATPRRRNRRRAARP